jgi:hypothetical protein
MLLSGNMTLSKRDNAIPGEIKLLCNPQFLNQSSKPSSVPE